MRNLISHFFQSVVICGLFRNEWRQNTRRSRVTWWKPWTSGQCSSWRLLSVSPRGKTSIQISWCIIPLEHIPYFYAVYFIISLHVAVLLVPFCLVLEIMDLSVFYWELCQALFILKGILHLQLTKLQRSFIRLEPRRLINLFLTKACLEVVPCCTEILI